MNTTMADLRREVAQRLRDTLHGKEIDTFEKGMPEIEHMLGIVTIGAISTTEAEAGTLLDPEHRFWQEYDKDVNTKNGVKQEIKTAMHSLKEDDIFRVSTPYGEESGIMYVEVADIESKENSMMTTCAECGGPIETEPELKQFYGTYRLIFKLDCDKCDFTRVAERDMHLRRLK